MKILVTFLAFLLPINTAFATMIFALQCQFQTPEDFSFFIETHEEEEENDKYYITTVLGSLDRTQLLPHSGSSNVITFIELIRAGGANVTSVNLGRYDSLRKMQPFDAWHSRHTSNLSQFEGKCFLVEEVG